MGWLKERWKAVENNKTAQKFGHGIQKATESVIHAAGDANGGQGVRVGVSENIDGEMIAQNYASQDLAKANNTAETWDDYVDIAKQSNYLSQETKQQLEESKTENQGENKMSTTATTSDQNWLERNQDWLLPLATTAATTAAQIWANNYQQKKQNEYNSQEAELNRQFNADQAQINRDWQENMSNTAITRQVADLENAGINPILASQLGGSAVTSGSQASGTAASSAGLMPMSMKDMMSTALTQAEIENMRADTDLKYKNTGKTEKEIETMEINNRINKAVSEAEIALKNAQNEAQRAQTKKTLTDNITQEYYNWHVQKYGSAPDTTTLNKITSKLEKFLSIGTNWVGSKVASFINEQMK